MAQVFPDEILVKIARSCVEPYHIAVSCKANRCRVKNVSDIRTSVGKLNGHSNLKLVNGLFDDEISAIMHHKFNGQLQIGAFDWEQDMDFNEVVSIFARPHCGLSVTFSTPSLRDQMQSHRQLCCRVGILLSVAKSTEDHMSTLATPIPSF